MVHHERELFTDEQSYFCDDCAGVGFLRIDCFVSAQYSTRLNYLVITYRPPVFGWKDENYHERIENQKCMISQDVSYQVFATCKSELPLFLTRLMAFESITVTTFYLPLIFILMLYWKIYQAARKRINKRKTETSSVKKCRKSEATKKFSTAKFRFSKRKNLSKEDWDSSQNSEAVSMQCQSLQLLLNITVCEDFSKFKCKSLK